MSPGKVVKLFKRARNNPLTMTGLITIAWADQKGRGIDFNLDNLDHFTQAKKCAKYIFNEITGDDIDCPEGPKLGRKLFNKRAHLVKKFRSDKLE